MIRFMFQGWQFDIDGNCLDAPNEPAKSNILKRVKARANRCKEAGGLVWASMGPFENQPPVYGQERMRLPPCCGTINRNLGGMWEAIPLHAGGMMVPRAASCKDALKTELQAVL